MCPKSLSTRRCGNNEAFEYQISGHTHNVSLAVLENYLIIWNSRHGLRKGQYKNLPVVSWVLSSIKFIFWASASLSWPKSLKGLSALCSFEKKIHLLFDLHGVWSLIEKCIFHLGKQTRWQVWQSKECCFTKKLQVLEEKRDCGIGTSKAKEIRPSQSFEIQYSRDYQPEKTCQRVKKLFFQFQQTRQLWLH